MNEFKFHLEQTVRLAPGMETGKIVGRAEYTYAENTYLVRYVAGDGRLVEAWWPESVLER